MQIEHRQPALCGIGFTMSLFISSLAFEETGVDVLSDERLGISVGSLASGFVGYLILNASLDIDIRGQEARSALRYQSRNRAHAAAPLRGQAGI